LIFLATAESSKKKATAIQCRVARSETVTIST
jgi:hypothetical protein